MPKALTVLGAGEVGRVVLRAAEAAGLERRAIRRGEPIGSALPTGPLVVAVRETDLAALIPELAPIADRTVFLQNGWIEPILAPLGPRVTVGLIWFTAKGPLFRVLAPSIFHGPLAGELVSLLRSGGIEAREEPDLAVFRREVAYKLSWNCVVGLPLAVSGLTLDAYLAAHEDEARAIAGEVAAVLTRELGVPVEGAEAHARLLATIGGLGGATGGTKALELRNGAIARLGRVHGVPTPVNDRLLARTGTPAG